MFDFVRHRRLFYLISAVITLPGIISMVLPGGFRPSIDFTGGTVMTIQFNQPVAEDALRAALTRLGHAEAVLQHTTDTNQFVVRTRALAQTAATSDDGTSTPSERSQVESALSQEFGGMQLLSLDEVSPLIAAGIVRDAVLAVGAASAFILLYLWWALRSLPDPWTYGSAAIAGLLHDAFAVLGIFSILGRVLGIELESTFIVAVLTVIGFSVHNSIVVFDRVRENLVRHAGEPFEDVVNHSIMHTLTRSLNTTLTVVLTLLVLMMFGGTTVRPFVLAILLGISVGGYSAVFFSNMLLVSWRVGELRRLPFLFPPRPVRDLAATR